MNPTLQSQIRTLKNYQAWRTGVDKRTIEEVGIVPEIITSALDAVIEIAENHLRDGVKKTEPVKVPSVDDSLTAAYMSGYFDGKKAAPQPAISALEPVAWITRTKIIGPDYGKESFGKLPIQSLNPLTYEHVPLITTDQAKVYADAMVREALEEAAEIAGQHNAFSTSDAILALIP